MNTELILLLLGGTAFILWLYATKFPASRIASVINNAGLQFNKAIGRDDRTGDAEFVLRLLPAAAAAAILIIAGGVTAIGIFLWLVGLGKWPLFILVGACLGWFIAGWQTVQQGEIASYKLFGKAVKDLSPGPVIAPMGIAYIKRLPSSTVRFVFGVQTNKDGAIIPNRGLAGETVVTTNVPFFVQFADWKHAANRLPDPEAYDFSGKIRKWIPPEKFDGLPHDPAIDDDENSPNEDPLQRQFNASPVVAVLLRVWSMRRFERAAGSIDNAFGNVSEIVKGVLSQFAGMNTLRFCMLHGYAVVDTLKRQAEWQVGDPDAIELYKRNYREAARDPKRYEKTHNTEFKRLTGPGPFGLKDTDEWGVDIESVQIMYWGTSYDFNKKQQDAATSVFDKQARVQQAQGEAEAKRINADADKYAANQLAASTNHELAKYKLALEAGTNMWKGTEKVIITPPGEGVANVLATGMTIGQQLQNAAEKKTQEGGKDKNKENPKDKDKNPQGGGGKKK